MRSSEISARFDLLNALVNWSKPIADISQALSSCAWDYDGEPYILKRIHLVNAIERLISNEVSPQELEGWANLIECREDIGFEESHREEIEQIIYRLANPELEGAITVEECRKLVKELIGVEIDGISID